MESSPKPSEGETLAKISNGLVALHMKYYGKGPEEARTYGFDDVVVCILKGGFTTVEQTLISEGREGTVKEMREHFQGAIDDAFIAVVEEALGRKVNAYVSQIHVDPDFAVEIFMLDPEP